MTPLCFDCLSENVAVKIIDECGFEHWFCAADWAALQETGEKIGQFLADAKARLEASAP